ncbi:MAG: (2Fe-2S) ferredoxin domain-containing protein [Anaerotruncus sp.]|nr:(2Fe-2S) ferredoxin domain-containing protein [Anaerotruncus sp.]
MDIYVCIGSSCHLKGSYNIIAALKKLVAEYHLEDKVNLNASFCLGHCQDGVTMKIDDQLVLNVNTENIREIFQEKVVKELGAS